MPPTDPQMYGEIAFGRNTSCGSDILPRQKQPNLPYEDRIVGLRGGMNVALRVWGDETEAKDHADKRWIAVHGFLDNAASYDLLAPELLDRLPGGSCIVAFDQAGHGMSDKRSTGVYYGADWAADMIQLADSLGWDKFNIVSHSLGGMISYTVAAVVPDRVLKLVVIEAIGFFSQDSTGQLQSLSTALTQRAKGQNIQKYDSLEAASARRAEMNIGGKLSVEAARLLVQRGTRLTADGSAYTWSSDPALLGAWRDAPSEGFVREILSGVQCPTLLIVADDGLWRKGRIWGMQLFSFPWSVAVTMAYVLTFIWHFCTTLTTPKGYVDMQLRGAPFVRQLEFCYKIMSRRLCLRTAKVHHLQKGGHHPQLTVPNKVADAVSMWLSQLGAQQAKS